MTRPNILLITTDQEQSFVDLPAVLDLPAHDRLRAEGVAFRRYHGLLYPSRCG